ncbi:hypothetical protein GZL_07572 [Streptomyces sp. 769]|nr:hypothetical protein GZL_07572 [Streptomyces sp. 769]
MPSGGLARDYGLLKEFECLLLKGDVIGVVGEPPGRIGAVLAGKRVARPAIHGNDQLESFGTPVLGPGEAGKRLVIVAEIRMLSRSLVSPFEVEQRAGDFWMSGARGAHGAVS